MVKVATAIDAGEDVKPISPERKVQNVSGMLSSKEVEVSAWVGMVVVIGYVFVIYHVYGVKFG